MSTLSHGTEVTGDYVYVGTRDLVIKESDGIDTVTIFGIKYALELFRLFATVDVGRCVQIIERKNGMITLRSLSVTDMGNGDFSFHAEPL